MSAVTLFQDKQWQVQHPSVIHYAKLKRHSVEVDGYEDSCFIALAVSFIDLIDHKQLSQSARSPLLSTILSAYYHLFPHFKVLKRGLETPFERFRALLESRRNTISLLISSLAYAFRQLAVDEILANPENYRGLLIKPEVDLDLHQLRQAKYSLGETAVVAMAKVLNMPIRVRETEMDKKVFNCLKYNEIKVNMLNPGVELAFEARSQQYCAKIVNRKLLKQIVVNNNPINEEVIATAMQRPLPRLDSINSKLIEQDIRLKHKYHSVVKRLQQALADNTIDKQQLIDLYIKHAGQTSSDAVSSDYIKKVFDQYYFES